MGRLPTGPPDPPNGRGEAEPGVVAGPPLPDAEPPVPAGRFPTAGVVPGPGLAGAGVAGACPPDAWGVLVGETGVPGLGGDAADPAGRGALRLRIGGRFKLANGRAATVVEGLTAGLAAVVEATVAAGETEAVEAWDEAELATAAAVAAAAGVVTAGVLAAGWAGAAGVDAVGATAAGAAGVGVAGRFAREGVAPSGRFVSACTFAGSAAGAGLGEVAAVAVVVCCAPTELALAPPLAVTAGAVPPAATAAEGLATVASLATAASPATTGAAEATGGTTEATGAAEATGFGAGEGPRPAGVGVPATGRCR